MDCKKCGAHIPDDSKFCTNCGCAIATESIATAGSEVASIVYAGFWIRFAAYLIDMAFIYIGSYAIVFVDFVIPPASGIPDNASALGGILMLAYIVLFPLLYFVLFESSSKQATLGKMALGIVVTDYDNKRISFLKAFGRLLGKIPSSIMLNFGYMMAGFTERKQALHDILAGTLVVKKSA